MDYRTLAPCRYLGLPLHLGRTTRADEQVLIDKIGAQLPGWKGRLLSKAGRLTLAIDLGQVSKSRSHRLNLISSELVPP